MGRYEVEGVPRYFEPYVNDCFTNAYGAVLSHMGLDPALLLGDFLSFMYDEESGAVGTNFLQRELTSVDFTAEELGSSFTFLQFPGTQAYVAEPGGGAWGGEERADRITVRMYRHEDPDIAEERLRMLLAAGRPVIVIVDLHGMSYHPAYRSQHGLHAVVVTGLDEARGAVRLIDRYELSSGTNYEGEQPLRDFRAARCSDTPMSSPLLGDYRRPIRHLWIELDPGADFRVTREALLQVLLESLARMKGQRTVLGQPCGVERILAFRRGIARWEGQPLDDRGVHQMRTGYNMGLKTMARSRRRFAAFLEAAAPQLGTAAPEELTAALEAAARRWEMTANLCLKFGISRSARLAGEIGRSLEEAAGLEAAVVTELERYAAACRDAAQFHEGGDQDMNTEAKEQSGMGGEVEVLVKERIREALGEVAVGIESRELHDGVALAELGVDSVKYVELLVAIEEKCDIVFDESDLGLNALRSLGDLTALVHKTLAVQAR